MQIYTDDTNGDVSLTLENHILIYDVFNFLWINVHTCSSGKKNKKIYFYWVSCFKMSQLTKDHMWKCDKTKCLSNNGSVKSNF